MTIVLSLCDYNDGLRFEERNFKNVQVCGNETQKISIYITTAVICRDDHD